MVFNVVILTGNCHFNNNFNEEFYCLDQLLHHLLQTTIHGSSIQLSDIILIVSQQSYPNFLHWSISRALNPSNVIIATDIPELHTKGNLLSSPPPHADIAEGRKEVLVLSSYLVLTKDHVLNAIIQYYENNSNNNNNNFNQQYDLLKLASCSEPDTDNSTVTIPLIILKSSSLAIDILIRFHLGLTYTYHHLLIDSMLEYVSSSSSCCPSSVLSYQTQEDVIRYFNPQNEKNTITDWYNNIQKNILLPPSSSSSVDTVTPSSSESVPPLVIIEETCHARIGLMGNPSDGFGGKTLSFLINNFSAKVIIKEVVNTSDCHNNSSNNSGNTNNSNSGNPSDSRNGGNNNSNNSNSNNSTRSNTNGGNITLIPHPIHDLTRFSGLDSLFTHSHIHGYYGGLRLIQAACKMFAQRCALVGLVRQWHSHSVAGRSIEISYDTDIPRMVGLSGSSAIVTAALRALMKYYCVTLLDLQLTQAEFCQVVLDVEKVELGISAGLQDRVVQSYGGLVHMDFSCMKIEEEQQRQLQQQKEVAEEVVAVEMNNPTHTGDVSSSSSSSSSTTSPSSTTTTTSSSVSDNYNNLHKVNAYSNQHQNQTSLILSRRVTGSGIKVGVYTSLDPELLPPLYLAYNTIAGGDSGQVHSTVKERWARRDPVLLEGMAALGRLADAAFDCLLSTSASSIYYNTAKNTTTSPFADIPSASSSSSSSNSHSNTASLHSLASLMDQNFAWRRRMYGDDVVGEINIRAVHIANEHGMAAKFTGSGGAIVCMRRDEPTWLSEEQEEKARYGFAAIHFYFVRVSIG